MTVAERARVVCLGETMGTVSPVPPEGLAAATEAALDVGGAESTVALNLTRLGVRTAWVSRVAADPFATRIRNLLDRRGVDTRWVEVDPTRPTGVTSRTPLRTAR